MTHSTQLAPSQQVSPKIIAGAIAGLAVAVVGAAASAIAVTLTPDVFGGPYGTVAYAATVAALGQVAAYAAGYIKTDPLRR